MASNAKIFEITVPRKDGLCCAICKIIGDENVRPIYSNYCSSKLKCRQFLQETPQAMASPIVNRKILEAGGSIYIIVEKESFENCAFQDHCDALNIQLMDLLDPIPTYIYKMCLLHTVECKLAPRWNKVGLYLVEGRNFLSSSGSVNAITLDIKDIYGSSARLQVEAINIKIPFVRLNAERPLPHDIQPPVRVLPSMKMASVLCISKTINEKFKDYEHLRTYWKDMHGYVLPDYEEGHLFYNLEFFYFKSHSFLYPETCLTSGPLQVLLPPIDPVPIIYRFASNLGSRVPKLCNQQLDICPENTYQVAITARTPTLPKTDGSSNSDSGYGTRSVNISTATPAFRKFDMCDIPTKRVRLSLPRTNRSEFDNSDYGMSSTCSTNEFQRSRSVSAVLCNADSAGSAGEATVQKEEIKSRYFEEKEEEGFENECLTELTDTEKRMKKQSLREKLMINKSNK